MSINVDVAALIKMVTWGHVVAAYAAVKVAAAAWRAKAAQKVAQAEVAAKVAEAKVQSFVSYWLAELKAAL